MPLTSPPPPNLLFYFQWPAPTNSSTARVLLEPPCHTHRKVSVSYLPKAVLSQWPTALGIGKPSCLALKPGHTLRCTFHSRFHRLLTLGLGFCLKSRLCLASFPCSPASPLPYQLLLGDMSLTRHLYTRSHVRICLGGTLPRSLAALLSFPPNADSSCSSAHFIHVTAVEWDTSFRSQTSVRTTCHAETGS